MKVLVLKSHILTKRKGELEKLGFEKRFDVYTGEISYYEGKGTRILLPKGRVEAIWCCGEIDEANYTEDIYNLITNNMVDLREKDDTRVYMVQDVDEIERILKEN